MEVEPRNSSYDPSLVHWSTATTIIAKKAKNRKGSKPNQTGNGMEGDDEEDDRSTAQQLNKKKRRVSKGAEYTM